MDGKNFTAAFVAMVPCIRELWNCISALSIECRILCTFVLNMFCCTFKTSCLRLAGIDNSEFFMHILS